MAKGPVDVDRRGWGGGKVRAWWVSAWATRVVITQE